MISFRNLGPIPISIVHYNGFPPDLKARRRTMNVSTSEDSRGRRTSNTGDGTGKGRDHSVFSSTPPRRPGGFVCVEFTNRPRQGYGRRPHARQSSEETARARRRIPAFHATAEWK